VHVTVPREFFALLEAARSALSHAKAGASDGEILVEGLKAIVERCAKRRGLAGRRSSGDSSTRRRTRGDPRAAGAGSGASNIAALRAAPSPRRREHIPAHVRRAVWERDGARCSFPLESGGVCGSTHQLELDHITPAALGGTSTVDDLRVACKSHNLDAARRVFGDAFIDACIRRRRAGGSGGARVAARGEAGT
jgi:HNH endonuclease